jgi:hypothetical protein
MFRNSETSKRDLRAWGRGWVQRAYRPRIQDATNRCFQKIPEKHLRTKNALKAGVPPTRP